MAHTTEIVDTGTERGHYFADILCCGTFHFRASVWPDVLADPQMLEGAKQRWHVAAATAHEAKMQSDARFHSLKGQKVTHDNGNG